jgi:hypothetical protein
MAARALIYLFVLTPSAHATTLYVTNSTGTGGTGTLADPFLSLQACVDQLVASEPAGSSCELQSGIYRGVSTVTVQGLHGELEAPYLIGSAPGASVTLDGTLPVLGPWEWQEVTHTYTDGSVVVGGHWKADWPDDGRAEPWQLFVDGEMMVPARWPNARWDDKTVFNDRYWAHGSMASTYCGQELRDESYLGPCRIVDGTAVQNGDMIYLGHVASGEPLRDLAATGINATGSSAILNIGHWYTFAAPVVQHTPGTADFVYEPASGWKVRKYKPNADLYYLEGSLALLDAETEWHYDRATRTIRLKTRGDVDPAMLGEVSARVQEYAIAISGCSHIVVKGLRLFATTVYAGGEGNSANVDIHNIRLDSLQLIHPSAMKRLLGDHSNSWPTTLARKTGTGTANNTLFNCTFFGTEGHPLINSAGSGVVFDNNLVEWTDWAAVTTRPQAYFDPSAANDVFGKFGSGAMTLEIDRSQTLEAPNYVRRNRVRHSGPSVGVAISSDNVHTELNHISHQYALQEDVGLLQMSGLQGPGFRPKGGEVLPNGEDPAWRLTNKRNWVHDALVERSTKWGMRFDRVNQECFGRSPVSDPEQQTWPYHGTMEHNVVWNCNGMMIKGLPCRKLEPSIKPLPAAAQAACLAARLTLAPHPNHHLGRQQPHDHAQHRL